MNKSRRTKEDYTGCVDDLFNLLKTAGNNGITVEQIIDELKLKGKIGGQVVPDSSAEELVSRMFKTLKKYGCQYRYDRKYNKYTLPDMSWTFPQELILTPVDQLALKIGWEVLESSVDFSDGVRRLEKNRNETFNAWRMKRFSFFKEEENGQCKLDDRVFTEEIENRSTKAEVLFNVFMAWATKHMLTLYMESGERKYLIPSHLTLSHTGWSVEGKPYSKEDNEIIQLKDVKIASFQ